jgi:hypothetical protein
MKALNTYIAFICLAILTVSCSKVDLDELESTWGRVSVTTDTTDVMQKYQEWTFSGGVLYIAYYYSTDIVIYDTASYSTEKKYVFSDLKYNRYITIPDLKISPDSAQLAYTGGNFELDLRGKWFVDRLEDGVLVIFRDQKYDENGSLVDDASFLFLEFLEK